jgi:hypothetical protein
MQVPTVFATSIGPEEGQSISKKFAENGAKGEFYIRGRFQ